MLSILLACVLGSSVSIAPSAVDALGVSKRSIETRGLLSSSLPTPVNSTFTKGTGTLSTGTYWYRVSAIGLLGETFPSPETSFALTGPAGVNVRWSHVDGALLYCVYGRSNGTEELLVVLSGNTTTWLDDGSLMPAGAMPTVDTSGYLAAPNLSGDNTGDVTIDSVGSASADGASLAGQVLSLSPADSTHPGIVTTGSQSLAGTKTFTADPIVPGLRVNTSAVGTCGDASNPEGRVIMVAGSGTAKTRMCVCTYMPTGATYAWVNALADYQNGLGNSTTCPPTEPP